MQENFVKIINAIYKVLEFFPEGDPLKNKAKEKALAILENPESKDIEVLEKYLELAKWQGWIDSMNFLIIIKELEKIKNGIIAKPEISVFELRHKEIAPASRGEFSVRQKRILQFLEKTEKVQVQDIIKEMPNVTKRTIRRDLDDLLKKGEITRIGDFNQVFYQKYDRT